MTPAKIKEHLAHLNYEFQKSLDDISDAETKGNLVKLRQAINAQQSLLYDTNKHINKTIKDGK